MEIINDLSLYFGRINHWVTIFLIVSGFLNLFFSFQMIMPSEIKNLLCVWDVFETILE